MEAEQITTADPQQLAPASRGPARRHRPGLLVLAAVAALLSLGAASAAPAGAMEIGGNGARGVPRTYNPVVTCKAGTGTIAIAPQASVEWGMSGQYVSYRYHLSNNRGYSGTSGWTGAQWIHNNNYLMGALPVSYARASLNTSWTVWVEYLHWRVQNGRWVYSSSGWKPASYFSGGSFSAGSGYQTTGCYT